MHQSGTVNHPLTKIKPVTLTSLELLNHKLDEEGELISLLVSTYGNRGQRSTSLLPAPQFGTRRVTEPSPHSPVPRIDPLRNTAMPTHIAFYGTTHRQQYKLDTAVHIVHIHIQ